MPKICRTLMIGGLFGAAFTLAVQALCAAFENTSSDLIAVLLLLPWSISIGATLIIFHLIGLPWDATRLRLPPHLFWPVLLTNCILGRSL